MPKAASYSLLNKSRRPSKLGDELANLKFDEARKLQPEQRLLMALDLSHVAAKLHRACLKKP